MSMQLVSTVTVGSGGAASIEFTSIPQDADDLLILFSGDAASDRSIAFQFNGDTGSNYTRRYLRGSGSAVLSNAATQTFIDLDNQLTTATASTFSNTAIYIPNYKSSTAKSVSADSVIENNATDAWQVITAATWTGTSAITSVLFFVAATTHRENTVVSLYKITKA